MTSESAPSPASSGAAEAPRAVSPACTCIAWQDQINKINGPIALQQARAGRSLPADHFIAWKFCPWCGNELSSGRRSEPGGGGPLCKCGHAKSEHAGYGPTCVKNLGLGGGDICSCEKYEPASLPSEAPAAAGDAGLTEDWRERDGEALENEMFKAIRMPDAVTDDDEGCIVIRCASDEYAAFTEWYFTHRHVPIGSSPSSAGSPETVEQANV